MKIKNFFIYKNNIANIFNYAKNPDILSKI